MQLCLEVVQTVQQTTTAQWHCNYTYVQVTCTETHQSPTYHPFRFYPLSVFTKRCHAERGIAVASCLSVRLSVCL